jgi:PEP-CTERM motif
VKKITVRLTVLLTASIAFVMPARAGLIIDTIFDNTITSDSNAASIEAVIDTAVQRFESLYSNPITVSILFQEGGGLGQSNDVVYGVPYTNFYSGLVANNANPAAIAGLNANGGNPNTNGRVNPVGGVNLIELKSANARAVGIDIPPGCVVTPTGNGVLAGNVPNECALTGTGAVVDGIISLNTAITTPPNAQTSPDPSYYDLLSTAEHEIDEVLGLGSALENCASTSPIGACQPGATLNARNDTPFGAGAPEDLFRWSAATGGARALSTNCTTATSAYFAYGPFTGAIARFNNACNGGDFGDWQSSPLPPGVNPQVQDAFADPGSAPAYGQSEIDAMTAIGYDLAPPTPEPGTMVLFAAGLAVLALYRRRSRPLR